MIEFIFETILFLLFLFSYIYLPGKFLANKLKLELKSPEDLFFPFGFGLLIFTFIAYIFSWVKLEVLIPVSIFAIDYLAIKSAKWKPAKIDKKHLKPFYLILFLSLVFSLSMLVVGRFGDSIIYRRDDTWHLALINELKANFPPNNPGISGVPLRGYHFFYNFIVAKVSNIFLISPISLHFRYFPLLISLMWGIGVYSVMFYWGKKISTGLWAVFLTMFGGSFAFIFTLQGHHGFGWDSGLGMQQSAFTLINPPLGISIVIILTALFAIFKYLSIREKKWLIPFVLSVGLISMFKVYAGIVLVGATGLLSVFEFFRKRYLLMGALLPISILFLLTYWIFAGGAGYLIYFPLWAPHSLLRSFPWYGFDEKMYTYSKQGVIRGVLETELYGISLFIFGNMGTRLVGILLLPILFLKKRRAPSLLALFVLAAALISLLVPLLFIQSGKVFEIIQMTQYFLFFCSLFAALGFSTLFNLRFNKLLKAILIAVILLVTLPSAYDVIKGYPEANRAKESLSSPYLQTMFSLSKMGTYTDTVLELPSDEGALSEQELNAWYKTSSPAIVGFANKRGYLNNQFIDFPGTDIAPRIAFLKKLLKFNSVDMRDPTYLKTEKEIKDELRNNKIKFIYSHYELPAMERIGAKKAYQNVEYVVYKLNN